MHYLQDPDCDLLEYMPMPDFSTGGEIIFEGQNITAKDTDINLVRRRMGMVFQQFNLFPHLTIRRNITIAPVKNKIMTQAQADKRADELLAMVGLSDKADAYPCLLYTSPSPRD